MEELLATRLRGVTFYKHLFFMWRAFNFSLRNLWRNFGLSFMTVIFITLACVMLATTILMYRLVQQGLATIERGVVLTLVLQPTVTEEQSQQLVTELKNSPGIEAVEYFSAEQVKANFLAQYQSDEVLNTSFSLLANNPLAAEIKVTASSASAYRDWLVKFSDGTYASLVSNKNIDDYQAVVDVLQNQVAKPIRYAGFIVGLIFAFITSILMFNTIRITLFTQRDEIGIMKLVGATNWFIRLPYILQTLWLVLIGAIIAYALMYLAASFAEPIISSTFKWPDYHLLDELTKNFIDNFWLTSIGLTLIAILSTVASLRRHLQV